MITAETLPALLGRMLHRSDLVLCEKVVEQDVERMGSNTRGPPQPSSGRRYARRTGVFAVRDTPYVEKVQFTPTRDFGCLGFLAARRDRAGVVRVFDGLGRGLDAPDILPFDLDRAGRVVAEPGSDSGHQTHVAPPTSASEWTAVTDRLLYLHRQLGLRPSGARKAQPMYCLLPSRATGHLDQSWRRRRLAAQPGSAQLRQPG